MYDPQLDDVEDPAERVAWRPAGHPILVGVAGVALAFGAWHALLRTMERPTEGVSTAGIRAPRPDLPADSLVRGGSEELDTRPDSGARSSAAAKPAAAPEDSGGERGMSPFLRSHPWAAVPGQPYYYPSRCPTTLRHADLLFYRTQAEAEAGGYVAAPDSGCVTTGNTPSRHSGTSGPLNSVAAIRPALFVEGAQRRVRAPGGPVPRAHDENLGLAQSPMVLVVDDESAVRTEVCRMIRGFGYPARSARGGQEALGVLLEHPREVRLLIADLGMPRMDGGELAERARDLDPGLRCFLWWSPATPRWPSSRRAIGICRRCRSRCRSATSIARFRS